MCYSSKVSFSCVPVSLRGCGYVSTQILLLDRAQRHSRVISEVDMPRTFELQNLGIGESVDLYQCRHPHMPDELPSESAYRHAGLHVHHTFSRNVSLTYCSLVSPSQNTATYSDSLICLR